MKLISINWQPTDRQLRQFGVACLIAFPMLTWIWVGGIQAVSVAAAIGLACTALGWAWPWAIRPLYLALSVLAVPLGMILGEIFLLLIYFSVVLPIGVMFRIRRRDALKLDFDRHRDSYWEPKKQPQNAKSYFRQF
jgi:hypothetical protein